ncbi:hypothetical protein DXG03_003055 [Asterophora parasitica]|uniref:Cytochrome b-c1 complex subunit 8 n=1 Tax=Asterophora parasitica TaxID=117018 RepID=A0A9P7G286_9AGAR|nr:hypothetical protein DXG03_003055 [Asterophora parasitica]
MWDSYLSSSWPPWKNTTAISPFQAKAAPHMIRNYLFNGYRRLGGELIFWIIPFATGFGIYSWAKKYDAHQHSKAGQIASGEHH